MSAASAARLVLRSPALRRAPVRHASTTSEAASKAKDTAQTATSKASQGLTRVTASATSAITKAGPALGNALGSIGGRTGRVISLVQSLIPPTVYYSRVFAELSKQIFHGQKMYLPNTAQFQQYFQPLYRAITNPSSIAASNPGLLNPQTYLQQARNMSSAQLTSVAIVLAELVGFFTVGEMIGRFKIVGYHGGSHLHEDEH